MSNIIYRGESKDLLFSIKNANGQPANLLGASATFRFGSSFGSTFLFSKVGVLTNPVGGVINVFIDEADTQDLSAGPYIYELVIELDGNTTVASQGTINILSSLLESP
jgi:hypothetical protein